MGRPPHRIAPTLAVETQLWETGYERLAGLDEAGRGAWAGPVYAGAVILPHAPSVLEALAGVRYSTLLSPAQRAAQWARIEMTALAVGVGWAAAAEIDALGIVPATRLAMKRALAALALPAEALIIDALRLPAVALPQQSFPFADALSLSVAAASIVAKVHRDRWMSEQAEVDFPGYGFAQHKGYGTAAHQAALAERGPCALHRRSFAPIAALR